MEVGIARGVLLRLFVVVMEDEGIVGQEEAGGALGQCGGAVGWSAHD